MDQFGVLVESIGFKSQGKSAPMADLKGNKMNRNNINDGFPQNLNDSFADDLDGTFRSNNGGKTQHYANNVGSMFDLDSVFKGSSNIDDDDIFGLKSSRGSVGYDNDDVFGIGIGSKGGSPPKRTDSVDDLLGDFDGMGMKLNDAGKKLGNASQSSDDLIPGFGRSSSSSNTRAKETFPSRQSSGHSPKSFSNLAEDPFVVLERAHGKTGNESKASHIDDYLDSFFSPGTQSSTGPSQKSTAEDFMFDAIFRNKESSKVSSSSFGSSFSAQKAPSVTNTADDFSFLFGMEGKIGLCILLWDIVIHQQLKYFLHVEAAPSTSEFQEIEGESKDRRRARWNNHIRTQERMAKVLNEKNQRDLQTQREQEERHRLADTLDADIKRWAAGKEGNLRALLSSLQHVLWMECGWQPVSLTDLITSMSVKKVYHKATLCVHPDKVQQKGANIQQKYIAEKVFDLLKEAWNKFNMEELRKQ